MHSDGCLGNAEHCQSQNTNNMRDLGVLNYTVASIVAIIRSMLALGGLWTKLVLKDDDFIETLWYNLNRSSPRNVFSNVKILLPTLPPLAKYSSPEMMDVWLGSPPGSSRHRVSQQDQCAIKSWNSHCALVAAPKRWSAVAEGFQVATRLNDLITLRHIATSILR